MTTSRQPWSLSPLDACVVLDADGREVARFADARDAERVVTVERAGLTMEFFEELKEERDEAFDERDNEARACTELEAENKRLEEKAATMEEVARMQEVLVREAAPQPRFTTPLPWFPDWQTLELRPALNTRYHNARHQLGFEPVVARFGSTSDLDYVVRLLEQAQGGGK